MFNTEYPNLFLSFSAINWSWITDLECASLTIFKSLLVIGLFAEPLTLWIASLVENKEIEIQWQKQNKSQPNLWM